MGRHAITLDFHNTLVACDAWFDLEVRHLVSAFLQWDANERGDTVDPRLLSAADASYRRIRRAIHLHGHELPAERSVATVLSELGVSVPFDRIAAGVEILMRSALAELQPMPGAIETVEALANTGIPVAVVSSAVYHPFLIWALDQLGMRDAIQEVVTSASAGYYKSRPEIYWHALDLLEVDPGRSAHVGDSLRFDVGGARRAGMRAVWLSNGAAPGPDDAQPDLVLSTLSGSASAIVEVATSPTSSNGHVVPTAVPTASRR